MGSIIRTIPLVRRGRRLADNAAIFLLIAFETTDLANVRRRRRAKRLLGTLARDGLITVQFVRDGEEFTFTLRAAEAGDLCVASEFIRGVYLFPDANPAQIIDGGANIGLFTVLASRRFPNVMIECFEVNPANIDALRRNIAANGANAEVVNKALWSGDGELEFHSHMAYSGFVTEAGDHDKASDDPGARGPSRSRARLLDEARHRRGGIRGPAGLVRGRPPPSLDQRGASSLSLERSRAGRFARTERLCVDQVAASTGCG